MTSFATMHAGRHEGLAYFFLSHRVRLKSKTLTAKIRKHNHVRLPPKKLQHEVLQMPPHCLGRNAGGRQADVVTITPAQLPPECPAVGARIFGSFLKVHKTRWSICEAVAPPSNLP
jgi:hypothetical protein